MTRAHRGRPRARNTQTTKNVTTDTKHLTADVAQGSGSHSVVTPPAIPENNWINVWDPEGEAAPVDPAWQAAMDEWNNPVGDNMWEWEAAGDESIASDDPYRDKKLAWRKEHDHVYSAKHRVSRWREKLPVKRLLLSRTEEIEACVEQPPKGELWDGRSGCRLRSRSRSRSKGRQGRRDRAAKIEDWKDQVERMIADGAFMSNDPDLLPRAFSNDHEQWIDNLRSKSHWGHVRKSRAKAFFELSLRDKVCRVEMLSRELANGPTWDV